MASSGTRPSSAGELTHHKLRRPASASSLLLGADAFTVATLRRTISPKLWSTVLSYQLAGAPDASPATPLPAPPRRRPMSGVSRSQSAKNLPPLPPKEHQMSMRRIEAIEGVWQKQVAKCEKIEEDASALADLRLHEALVAQRCTESRAEHVSRAWQTLVAVGEPGAGSAPELGDAEATREAVREHLLACVHHEEINSLLRIAEREASVAAGCAQNTAEMRAVQRTKVAAKRAQETEALEHRRQLVQARHDLEMRRAEERARAAAERARVQEEQEAARRERAAQVAVVIAARRQAAEEKEKAAAEEAERVASERGRVQGERARAREEAQARARREAELAYAQRLEKVWKHAEAHVVRCERAHASLLYASEQQRLNSSFTQGEIARRKAALDAARARAAAAREALQRCLRGPRCPSAERE